MYSSENLLCFILPKSWKQHCREHTLYVVSLATDVRAAGDTWKCFLRNSIKSPVSDSDRIAVDSIPTAWSDVVAMVASCCWGSLPTATTGGHVCLHGSVSVSIQYNAGGFCGVYFLPPDPTPGGGNSHKGGYYPSKYWRFILNTIRLSPKGLFLLDMFF